MQNYAYAEVEKNLAAVFAAATREKVVINFPDGKRFHLQSATDLQSVTDLQSAIGLRSATARKSSAVKKSPPRRTRKQRMADPTYPSPSGDPYFDDPRNMAEIMEGIRQFEAGQVVSLDDEELQAIFRRCRQ